ncbi:MAG TPA: HAD family hydrolase [Actinobacteria bacterium]|jgi:putative hydrolase of the HAD superfamily|nr:HAD family hydrolase [Actinomycetota bacterium]
MSIRAVVFDWGGTLTPWHDIDLVSQWYAYAEIYDPEHASPLAHRLAEAEVHRWKVQQESHGAEPAGALDQLFLDEGIDITGARHLRALGSYLDFWAPHTAADPQARPLMEDLRSRGYRIGVLSNTMWPSRHHREVFERDDLITLIDAAFYTSEMPVAKPHGEAFAAVLAALGVAASETVFVGDRIWDDIAGASRAGLRTIWIPHSTVPPEQVPDASATPDAVAHELRDVLGIVESWQ